MRIILHSSSFYVLGAVVLIGIALTLLINIFGGDDKQLVTATVERGSVAEFVAVSGVVEAKNTAALAFPLTGIVTDVLVNEGDMVETGDVLARLESSRLAAERLDAVGALQKAIADKDELLAGPTTEARTVTEQVVKNAEANLAQVTAEQNEKVQNTKRLLLSSSLQAHNLDEKEDAVPPTISGTYVCDTEGSYVLDMYNSSSPSGYSFTLSGIESGTYTALTEAPGKLGTCGLFIQFDANSFYSSSEWEIPIPNSRSTVYQTNLNTYNLAVQQHTNAIDAAEQALALAKEEASFSNASPRVEALARANASILQAQARINAIDAEIKNRSIIAPFSGTITDVSILPGETAGTAPVITLLASNNFDLRARIPEIDITKIQEGQYAEVLFDAQSDEIIPAEISFISPLATEIDGVAYFEAIITFDETPSWLRSGLNADITITVHEVTDTLRIPIRFIQTTDDESTVFLMKDNELVTKEVALGFTGNDGFVEIIGLNEGDTVVAP